MAVRCRLKCAIQYSDFFYSYSRTCWMDCMVHVWFVCSERWMMIGGGWREIFRINFVTTKEQSQISPPKLIWRDNFLNWLFNFQRAESYKRWHEDWWKQKFKFKQEVVHVLLPHWLYGISIDSDPLFIQQQLSEYVVFPLFLLGCSKAYSCYLLLSHT